MWFPDSLPHMDAPCWTEDKKFSAVADFRLSAWHEAGHAVVNTALGREVTRIVLETDHWSKAGWTEIASKQLAPEAEAITWLAGMAAEIMSGNEDPWGNARTDIGQATRLAAAVVGPFLAAEAVDECWQTVIAFMERDGVAELTREIAAHGMLRGHLKAEQLRNLLSRFGGPLPQILPPIWNQLSLPLEPPKQTPHQLKAANARRWGLI